MWMMMSLDLTPAATRLRVRHAPPPNLLQVVWRGTTQVGCAVADCGGSFRNFYVCNYSPQGNIWGQFAQNVYPPV